MLETPIYDETRAWQKRQEVERAGQEAREYVRANLTVAPPFAERVCEACGATGKEPCRYPSGKARRLYHVKRR